MTNVGARPLNLDICFGKLLEDMVGLVFFLVASRQFSFSEYWLLSYLYI